MSQLRINFRLTGSLAALVLACTTILSACSSSSHDSPPLDKDPVPAVAAESTLTFPSVKKFRFSWSDVSDANYYKLLENPDGVSGFTQVGSDVPQGTERVDHIVPLYARTNAQYILQSCTDGGCIDSDIVSVSGTLTEAIGYFKASNTDWNDQFGHSVSLSADGSTLAIGTPGEDSNAIGVNGNQNDQSATESGAVYVLTSANGQWRQQAYLKASNTNNEENADRTRDWFGRSVVLSGDGNTLVVGAPEEDSIATGINGNQNDNSASRSGAAYVFTRNDNEWSQQAYLKASNNEVDVNQGDDEWGDFFGDSVSLSADGNTLAVGAPGEDSNATGVDGNQSDNSEGFSGAVYVFTRRGSEWNQTAYLKASNTHSFNYFGDAVSLSANGNTLAVGAWSEWSDATGINGHGNQEEFDDSTRESGAAYVFIRSGDTWIQDVYLKAGSADSRDWFGKSVSLNADGSVLAVGAPGEDSNAAGINDNQGDFSATRSGAVYVFRRNGNEWSQHAFLTASNSEVVCDSGLCRGDGFGGSVSLSADGNSLAVGATGEDSNATGVNGDQNDNSLQSAGAVYVFTRSIGEWVQQAYVKASNTDVGHEFGRSVSLNADGNTLAVGAPHESSNATGVNGNQSDNSFQLAGAVYLF